MAFATLTDERAKEAKTTIGAALKKAGVTGAAAKLLLFQYLRRVEVADSGALGMTVGYPYFERGDRYRDYDRTPDWLARTNDKWLPLDKAMAIELSDDSPSLELAQRQHIVDEENRQLYVRTMARHAEELHRKALEKAATDRLTAWNDLPRELRATKRLPPGSELTTEVFANLLAAEPATNSTPPDHWPAVQS